jgi:polysaccharide export outer membrane protein
MQIILRTAVLAACALFAGGNQAPSQIKGDFTSTSPPTSNQATSRAATITDEDYTLGVGDKMRITVYNESNLTGEYPVNANGKISMALIGEVTAAGMTPSDLANEVTKQLANGYLRKPQVAIDVLTFRPFYIMGEVTKPGEYPSTSGLTVMNAVATAQGFTYRANKKFAYIRHAGETEERKVALTPDLRIRPGDSIRVTQRFF